MTRRNLVIALALLLILLAAFFLVRNASKSPVPAATEIPLKATETVEPTMEPEKTESIGLVPTQTPAYENPFSNMEIQDINGQPFDVSIFSGKPFMLNVWASWCGPCVQEMPDLDALSKEYGYKINIIGLMGDSVTVGSKGELVLNQAEIDGSKALYEKLGISYPSLIPNEFMLALMQQIPIQYFPTTLFFNGEGYLVDMQVGSKSKEDWALDIDRVLAAIQEEKAK